MNKSSRTASDPAPGGGRYVEAWCDRGEDLAEVVVQVALRERFADIVSGLLDRQTIMQRQKIESGYPVNRHNAK